MPDSSDRIVLGDESAEHDAILYDCPVRLRGVFPHTSLITGRWGTGKTAHILLDYKELRDHLKANGVPWRKTMYLDESGLDTEQLVQLYNTDHELVFSQKVERIWRAEITRRAIVLLQVLAPTYEHASGSHWKVVTGAGKFTPFQTPLWRQLPEALKALANFSDTRAQAIDNLELSLEDIYSDKMLSHVQGCLRDIPSDAIRPRIAVEPIDTPTSALEDHAGLAEKVITALLNVYQSTFARDEDQLLRIDIAVPWHRLSVAKINFPQKLQEYKVYLQWQEDQLREFINLRLEWEFRRVHRSFQTKGRMDAWNAVFEPTVKNDHCSPAVAEDSFEYVLRHTHHRPRDLQRLTRKCIETCADRTGRSLDDVLRGVGGLRVADTHIREAVRGATRDAFEKELVVEGTRRYSSLPDLVERLRGMPTPFSLDDLGKRVLNVDEAIDTLWQCGVLGVELVAADGDDVLRGGLLPGEARRDYRSGATKSCHKWTFFEYNWDGEPNELLQMSTPEQGITPGLVLHPKSYEFLLPRVATDWPIGI